MIYPGERCQVGNESRFRVGRKASTGDLRRRGVGRFSHRVRVTLLVPVLGIGLMGAGFAAFSAVSSGASNPPPLGIYEGYENASGVSSLGSAIGRQPNYAMDYLDGTSWSSMESGAASEAASWSASGYSMTFSVPMLPNSGATLSAGAAGDYDSYFQSIAQALVAHNEASSIVRIGWEFNGSWTPWYANSSDASEFVTFWQHIVDAMRSVSGADFKFEWCPNLGDSGDLTSFYPGNGYVDYVAADVYDQSWQNYPGATQEFSNLESEPGGLNWLTSFASQQGKPVALGEWGLGPGPGHAGQDYSASNQEVSGGDDPTFIDDMANWIAANNVYEATYFDFGPSALSSSSNSNSYHALIADFGPSGVAGGPAGASTSTATSAAPAPTTTTTAPPAPTPAPTTTTAPPAPTVAPTTITAPPPTSGPPPSATAPTSPNPAPSGATPPTSAAAGSSSAAAPTVTTLKTSELLAMEGSESSMIFTVSVTPAENSTVDIMSGDQRLCQVTVTTSNGTGSCTLTDSELGLGVYTAHAETAPGPDFSGSSSDSAAFTVLGLNLLSAL
jgi:hypothetical protein